MEITADYPNTEKVDHSLWSGSCHEDFNHLWNEVQSLEMEAYISRPAPQFKLVMKNLVDCWFLISG